MTTPARRAQPIRTDCEQKGYRYWNQLQTTLFQAKIVDRSNKIDFDTYYNSEYGYSELPNDGLHQSLINRGISITKMDYWATSSKHPVTQVVDDPAFLNYFDTRNGVIIADANFNEEDKQKKLPWSELIYQTWALANVTANANAVAGKGNAPGGPISNLQSIVRRAVTNEGTRTVISTLYKANGLDPGQDGPEGWNKWTEEDHHDFFFGLLGTDNLKGVLYLLNDHAAEIGKKEVSAIYTRWTGNLSPDIWIDIAPTEQAQLPARL